MKKYIFTIILIIGLFWAGAVLAHQPRLVLGNDVVKIENPEISQAFYGKLNGQPKYFIISEKAPFPLYLNILMPYTSDAKKDFIVDVFRGTKDLPEEKIYTLDGPKSDWKYFYEEFAGDEYWQGPELKVEVASGDYLIKISNAENMGAYSLVVGEIESFPPNEILNTLILLPQLKSQIFNKSPLTAYFNVIGEYLGLLILGIIILVIIILMAVKYVKKGKK
jgi:hypothetical protein